MKQVKVILLVVSIAFFGNQVKGQQLAHYSQFFLNDYVLNPAVGGTNPYFDVKSTYRYQWVGIEDAPRTFLMSMHGPFNEKGNMGIGGYVYSDVTGPTRKTGFKASYSYNFKLNDELKLSFGLAGGLMQFAVDGSDITLKDQNDQAIGNVWQAAYTPDAAFGAYLYHEDFFVGLSIPQLIGTKLQLAENYSSADNSLKNHYFISGGYTFHITYEFDFEPFVQGKYIPPTNPQVDIGGRFIWNEMVWLGGIFRTEDAATIFAGVNFLENFTFGYSYDVITNDIKILSSGSHEIVLGLKFNERKD